MELFKKEGLLELSHSLIKPSIVLILTKVIVEVLKLADLGWEW